MDVTALLQSKPEAPHRSASSLLAQTQLFSQLLDQHLISHQDAANREAAGEHHTDAHDSDGNQDDDTAEQNDEQHGDVEEDRKHRDGEPLPEALDIGATPALVAITQNQGALTTHPTPTSERAVTSVPTAQMAANRDTQAGQPRLQPLTESLTSGQTAKQGNQSPQTRHGPQLAAQVTAETTAEIQSRAPTTISSSATSVQEQTVDTTSLRSGRDELIARHSLQANAVSSPPVQPKPSSAGSANHPDQNVATDKPGSGHTTSLLQAISVKPTPSVATTLAVSQQPTPVIFAGDDLLKPDLGFERAIASQLTSGPAAKTAIAKPTPSRGAMPPTQQVAMQIRQAVNTGADHIRIQLQPAELGKVDVRMTIVDQSVQAVVTVDRPETLEQLQRDSRELLLALEDAGLKTDSESLTFRHREAGGQGLGQDDMDGGSSNASASEDADEQDGKQPAESDSHRAPRHDGLISIEA